MQNRITTVLAAATSLLLVAAVAWASGLGDSERTSTSLETSTSAQVSSPSTEVSSPSTSTPSSSTSLDSSSTTSVESSSSTLRGDGSTSTSIDDRDETRLLLDGVRVFDVAGAATVTVEIRAGTLLLLDVNARAGWSVEIDKARTDEIRIKFEKGDADAEIRVRIRDGQLRSEVKVN